MNKLSNRRAVTCREREQARRVARRRRLAVEEMESRTLLATFIVSTTADSGEGSLREAIDEANLLTGPASVIEFQVTTPILLDSDLPAVIRPALFNTVLPDPTVTIQPAGITSTLTNGLVFNANAQNSVVSDITITGYTNAGIVISGTSGVSISGISLSGGAFGVQIANSAQNTIGTGTFIDSATTAGIEISGATSAGNLVSGVEIFGGTGDLIGVEIDGHAHDNTLSGSDVEGFDQDGVLIIGSADNNAVIGGFFGGNAEGIRIDNASGNSITGSVRTPGEITENQGVGVHVTNGATNNLIDHEIIGGTTAGSEGPTGNLGDGVLIDAGATLTTVSNNTIGFNLVNPHVTGSGNGVDIQNSSVASGVNNLIVANTIIGNAAAGVALNATNNNVLLNNFVGIDSSMTAGLGNTAQGVVLFNAFSNTIGGSSGQAGNLIANNGLSGVEIGGANSSNNVVEGDGITSNGVGISLFGAGATNVIGFNAIGSNKGNGVSLFATARASIVGNAIAANGTTFSGFGVSIENSGSGLVFGNTIQLNAAGGVGIVSSSNITVTGNTISNNTHADGVLISGSSTNAVTNNTIAGNGSATPAGGYAGFGIVLVGATVNTPVSANNSISGNTVTGNQSGGIGLLSGTNGTILTSNRIGLPGAGNANFGVVIDGATGNTVGSGNVITANASGGIALKNSTTTGNVVLGSFIGTDASGKAGLGNAGTGVLILNAPGNIVGYTVIAANQGFGIEINGAAASKNNVVFNIVGTTNSLATGMGNALEGIRVTGAPNSALVSNLVTANKLSGVDLVGASGTLVSANLIGSVPNAGVPGNAAAGLFLNGSTGSFVGLNTLSGNAGDGLDVAGGSVSNTIAFNVIGAFGGGAANSNLGNGVQINNASSTTLIGNSILSNMLDGVLIDNFSRTNSLSGNVVNGNSLAGVDLIETSGNTVGGTTASTLNVLFENVLGVEISSSSSNVIGNNQITGNAAGGVWIFGDQSQGNVLTSNILVNNHPFVSDVSIFSGATSNTLSNNTLRSTIGFLNVGVNINGDVTDGGVSAGRNNLTGNTITGFQQGGVALIDTSGNTLASGNSIVGNSGAGVLILGTASGNTLSGNVISGNISGASGVLISGMSATGNVLFGNRIGLDANGAQLPNDQFGVLLQGTTGNDVGSFGSPGATNPGVVAGVPQNIIAGNGNDDVRIAGGGFNVVQNNFLGTNALGQALGGPVQAVNGVTIRFSNGNVITHNLISGHGSALFRNAGVLIDTDVQANSQVDEPLGESVDTALASVNNNVSFNLIGTDASGRTTVATSALNAGLQNTQGIVISGASSTMVDHNVIGGSIEVGIQVFNAAGSTRNGQTISTNPTTNNTIVNNLIGAAGGRGAANGGGIFLNDVNGTTVGGAAGSSNTISGNTGAGVQLLGRASKNTVLRNVIAGNVQGIFLNGVAQTSKIQTPNSGSNFGGDLVVRQVQSGPFVDNSSINAQGTSIQITFGQYVDATRVLDPTLYHIQALGSPSGIAGAVPFAVGGYDEETRTVTLVLGETLNPLTTNFQLTIGLGSEGGLTNRVTTAASPGFDGDTLTARFILDGNNNGSPGGQYLATHRTTDAINAEGTYRLR